MNTKTEKERNAVVDHFKRGGHIKFCFKSHPDYWVKWDTTLTDGPDWNWEYFEYQIDDSVADAKKLDKSAPMRRLWMPWHK